MSNNLFISASDPWCKKRKKVQGQHSDELYIDSNAQHWHKANVVEVIVPLLIEPLLIPYTDSPKTAHIAWQPSSAILTCFSSLFLWPLASAGNFSIEQRPLRLAAALLNPQKKTPTHSTSRWKECYGCKTYPAVLILAANGFSVLLYRTLCSLVLM